MKLAATAAASILVRAILSIGLIPRLVDQDR
jgi:hypothetical protein